VRAFFLLLVALDGERFAPVALAQGTLTRGRQSRALADLEWMSSSAAQQLDSELSLAADMETMPRSAARWVCVRERERERECVCVCVSVCL
jgi:hypothetical protein